MNAVTCTHWIRRGIAKQHPDVVKLDENDLKKLINNVTSVTLSDDEDDYSNADLKRKKAVQKSDDKNKTEEASEAAEEASDEKENMEEGESDGKDGDSHNPLDIGAIAFYGNPADDPHLVPDQPDSDEEELEILADENLIAVGKVKKDFCSLEVYVHSEKDHNCWCHHDVILPTIPLCLEWLDFDCDEQQETGNFLAVGSVAPEIEIWDMDVVNTLEPAFTLAGASEHGAKKGKKKKRAQAGHSDAVLALSWNKQFRHVLASGSADKTAAMWDLEQRTVVSSISHEEKVQTLQWQPGEAPSLLTGCADGVVSLFDCRNIPPSSINWTLEGEVEQVLWDIKDSHYFLAVTSAGLMYYYDIRNKTPVYKLNCHENGVSSVAQSTLSPNCVVTTGEDKCLKVWDIARQPAVQILQKKMNMGQLFNVSGCPDSALLFAVAGETEFRVLDLARNPSVVEAFGLTPKSASTEDGSTAALTREEATIGYEFDEDNSSVSELHVEEGEVKGEGKGKEKAKQVESQKGEKKRKRRKKKALRKLNPENTTQDGASPGNTTQDPAISTNTETVEMGAVNDSGVKPVSDSGASNVARRKNKRKNKPKKPH